MLLPKQMSVAIGGLISGQAPSLLPYRSMPSGLVVRAPKPIAFQIEAPWLIGLKRLVNALPDMRDPSFDDTMGFRSWAINWEEGYLESPHQETIWHEAELHCEKWDDGEVVRGNAGIHAHFVPIGWRHGADDDGEGEVQGIVERFGRYALGTEGWRAEWVIIRKFVARNRFIAAGLKEMYPDIEIVMQLEGD